MGNSLTKVIGDLNSPSAAEYPSWEGFGVGPWGDCQVFDFNHPMAYIEYIPAKEAPKPQTRDVLYVEEPMSPKRATSTAPTLREVAPAFLYAASLLSYCYLQKRAEDAAKVDFFTTGRLPAAKFGGSVRAF